MLPCSTRTSFDLSSERTRDVRVTFRGDAFAWLVRSRPYSDTSKRVCETIFLYINWYKTFLRLLCDGADSLRHRHAWTLEIFEIAFFASRRKADGPR